MVSIIEIFLIESYDWNFMCLKKNDEIKENFLSMSPHVVVTCEIVQRREGK
jgi:hypothetical protein